MKGDIIYVNRYPMKFNSIEERLNENSCWLDQLIVRFLTYKHYGVEVEDEQVIHFYCSSIVLIHKGFVEKIPMAEFIKDGKKEVDNSIPNAFPPNDIARRALSMTKTNFEGYHITRNNCEHFAVWCASGEREAKQNLIKEAWHRWALIPVQTREKVITALAFFGLFH
jgi:hypothetical protein